MHPYLTYREEDPTGQLQYYILQKEHPHYVARVSTAPYSNALAWSVVPHHKMVVEFSGCLQGQLLPARPGIMDEVTATMHLMALWFYEHRIQVNPKKYQKWHFAPQKINS